MRCVGLQVGRLTHVMPEKDVEVNQSPSQLPHNTMQSTYFASCTPVGSQALTTTIPRSRSPLSCSDRHLNDAISRTAGEALFKVFSCPNSTIRSKFALASYFSRSKIRCTSIPCHRCIDTHFGGPWKDKVHILQRDKPCDRVCCRRWKQHLHLSLVF